MADEEKPKLNPKQELFCKLYASDRDFFANGVQSYIEAYDIDTNEPGAYNGARASASKLLTNTAILTRINEILELEGLNDVFVDKQLNFLITQNADLSTKARAINEYNKLKSRITEKKDITSGGKPIPILMNIPSVPDNDSDQQNSEAIKTNQGSTGWDISQQDNLDTPLIDSLQSDGQKA
jgi:phage terminase small subunit